MSERVRACGGGGGGGGALSLSLTLSLSVCMFFSNRSLLSKFWKKNPMLFERYQEKKNGVRI